MTIIYLSGAIRPEFLGREDAGLMLQPDMGNRPDLSRTHWAADNGCFAAGAGFRLQFFLTMLEALDDYARTCLFAVAPDVVGDARATLERSMPVLPIIRGYGYRPAFVLQEGFERIAIPWDGFHCLFVGGLTEAWKFSDPVLAAVREAKERGKWTHLGRVNSWRRFSAATREGYDSADGTFREVWTRPERPEGASVVGAPAEATSADQLAMRRK